MALSCDQEIKKIEEFAKAALEFDQVQEVDFYPLVAAVDVYVAFPNQELAIYFIDYEKDRGFYWKEPWAETALGQSVSGALEAWAGVVQEDWSWISGVWE